MIYLLGRSPTLDVLASDLRERFDDVHVIVTTNCMVSGEQGEPIEAGDGTLLGFIYPGEPEIISIDHHGSDPGDMTSTHLALQFVASEGVFDEVAITDLDYDSVAAAGVLTGALPLDGRLAEAAIAATYTGDENVFADTLQGLLRDRRDAYLALWCLKMLLQGGEDALPPEGKEALRERRKQRASMKSLVREGIFQDRGNGVIVADLDKRIIGEMLPGEFPSAKVIITVLPPRYPEEGNAVEVRLGNAAPGKSLLTIGLQAWGWRGRWNAGSTEWTGGTYDPEPLIKFVVGAVNGW